MTAVARTLFSATVVLGALFVSSPQRIAAQSVVEKVGTAVSKGAKTTEHNVVKGTKKVAHVTKKAAKSTARATANAVVGHKILCSDGTWASRDNPTCSDHAGVAARQPGDRDKH